MISVDELVRIITVNLLIVNKNTNLKDQKVIGLNILIPLGTAIIFIHVLK